MTDDEQAFLAQIALGWFTVDASAGAIWRNVRFHGGGVSLPRWISPTRAERSVSKQGAYLRVMFNDAGERRRVSAHRIIWMVANRRAIPAGLEVNHRNGNKQHNTHTNLELATHAENAIHSVRVLGNKPKARLGEANAAARLTVQQVAEIRGLVARRSLPQRELAAIYGVSQGTISAIVTGKSWA